MTSRRSRVAPAAPITRKAKNSNTKKGPNAPAAAKPSKQHQKASVSRQSRPRDTRPPAPRPTQKAPRDAARHSGDAKVRPPRTPTAHNAPPRGHPGLPPAAYSVMATQSLNPLATLGTSSSAGSNGMPVFTYHDDGSISFAHSESLGLFETNADWGEWANGNWFVGAYDGNLNGQLMPWGSQIIGLYTQVALESMRLVYRASNTVNPGIFGFAYTADPSAPPPQNLSEAAAFKDVARASVWVGAENAPPGQISLRIPAMDAMHGFKRLGIPTAAVSSNDITYTIGQVFLFVGAEEVAITGAGPLGEVAIEYSVRLWGPRLYTPNELAPFDTVVSDSSTLYYPVFTGTSASVPVPMIVTSDIKNGLNVDRDPAGGTFTIREPGYYEYFLKYMFTNNEPTGNATVLATTTVNGGTADVLSSYLPAAGSIGYLVNTFTRYLNIGDVISSDASILLSAAYTGAVAFSAIKAKLRRFGSGVPHSVAVMESAVRVSNHARIVQDAKTKKWTLHLPPVVSDEEEEDERKHPVTVVTDECFEEEPPETSIPTPVQPRAAAIVERVLGRRPPV